MRLPAAWPPLLDGGMSSDPGNQRPCRARQQQAARPPASKGPAARLPRPRGLPALVPRSRQPSTPVPRPPNPQTNQHLWAACAGCPNMTDWSQEAACAASRLWKPTEEILQRAKEHTRQLYGDADARYVAVHMRLGGMTGEKEYPVDWTRGGGTPFSSFLRSVRCANQLAKQEGIAVPTLMITDNHALRNFLKVCVRVQGRGAASLVCMLLGTARVPRVPPFYSLDGLHAPIALATSPMTHLGPSLTSAGEEPAQHIDARHNAGAHRPRRL